VKKWYGSCNQNVQLEDEKEKQYYYRREKTSIKDFGYTFSKLDNVYRIKKLQEMVFLEKGIKNIIDTKVVTMKDGLYSRNVFRYEVPLYIKENLYYNNADLVEHKYIELGDDFYYTDRSNYELGYTVNNINRLMMNNYIGIISTKRDVGLFYKNKKVKCNFLLSYSDKDIRIKIMVAGFYD